MRRCTLVPALCMVACLACFSALGVDWPEYRGNAFRTAVSVQALPVSLALRWSRQMALPPAPAFRGGLHATDATEAITYDHTVYTIVAQGRVFLASSSEDCLFCLDADNGEELWHFCAEAPIRVAPAYWNGRVYFGADDGYVYCVAADSGALQWKFQAAPSNARCIGNERMISQWPVRSGVAIADGTAYFAAGVLPPQGVYLYALDAESGRPRWKQTIEYSANGQILVLGDSLWMPTGRTAPAEFSRVDGTPRIPNPDLRRLQGASSVGTVGEWLVYGPCESGILHIRTPETPDLDSKMSGAGATRTLAGIEGNAMLADELVYLLRKDVLLAVEEEAFREEVMLAGDEVDRRGVARQGVYGLSAAGQPLRADPFLLKALRSRETWSAENASGFTEVILCGDTLIAGGHGNVAAFDAATGKRRWAHPVDGAALGLAAADGALFVGTDTGWIYSFGESPTSTVLEHRPNLGASVAQDARAVRLADAALHEADTLKGFCLILGAGDGSLALEIARRSEYRIVIVDENPDRVAQVRARFLDAGIHGARVAAHLATGSALDYPRYFANLVIDNTETGHYPAAAVLPLVQPYGGVILTSAVFAEVDLADPSFAWQEAGTDPEGGWRVGRRGGLPGAGEWTHLYANHANTVCSNDQLLDGPLGFQWFGPPGAEDVVDRHNIAMPPLFKVGRLFYTGLNHTLQAIDAYNGTRLWKTEIPDSVRQLISHNSGFLCVSEDSVFVASGKTCQAIDVDAGTVARTFATPVQDENWGYVGTAEGFLVGSTHLPAVREYEYKNLRYLADARSSTSRPVASREIFVYDASSGTLAWRYREGVVLDPSICIGGGRLYFASTANPACVDDASGTADMKAFVARDASLVALDLATGQEIWRRPLMPNTDGAQWMLYLSYDAEMLLSTRSYWLDNRLTYELHVLDAATGASRWTDLVQSPHEGPYAPLFNGKNAAAAHPSIVNGRIYWLAHTFGSVYSHDLATGESAHHDEFGSTWENKGCAVPTASATAFFYRDTSCYRYDLASRTKTDLTRVTRPGCWMSMIPAGGLLLMPEASSGCTCGFAMQMSIALAPR